MTIEEYVERIDGFLLLKPSEQISYFGYFLTVYQGVSSFGAKDIDACFTKLHLPPYTNISAFLSKEKQAKRVLKNKNGGWQAVAGRWFLVFYCMRNYRQPVAENHQRWPIS